jgi:hypothetical protein
MVERVTGDLGLECDVRLVNVPDNEAAQKLHFLGSPTILVNGADIEPGAGGRRQYGLACRVYRTAAGTSGQPDPAWLHAALAQAAGMA